jgi:hypothetical protein
MLGVVLRALLMFLLGRILWSVFRRGPRPPDERPVDRKSAKTIGGKVVDAEFEDLPGGRPAP